MEWLRVAGVWSAAVLAVTSAWPGWAEETTSVRRFLDQYCVDCHCEGGASGDQNFESLDLAENSLRVRIQLQKIIDQLTLGAMPPVDAVQPTSAERTIEGTHLTAILRTKRKTATAPTPRAALRRLSHREYRNTIRDLLGLDTTMFDPTADFPADPYADGFDNDRDALVTSSFLLEQYLRAANTCVEKAFANLTPTAPTSWSFRPPFRAQPELDRRIRAAYGTDSPMLLYDNPNNDPSLGAYGVLDQFQTGVPADGLYQIRVRAAANHRDTAYDNGKTFFMDLAEPFHLGIRPGNTTHDDLYHKLPHQPLLATQAITDNRPQWYVFTVPLSAGFTPRFTFENGHHDVRGALVYRIREQHPTIVPPPIQESADFQEKFIWSMKHGQIPHIAISEITIRGPLAAGQRKSVERAQERLLGGAAAFDATMTETLIRRFATAAFRRPISSDELETLVAMYHATKQSGETALAAYKATLKAILCSPEFLYFAHPGGQTPTQNAAYGIAERLSFFLTSTVPDQRLLQTAESGTLQDRRTRGQEARRLLKSEASACFVDDFLDNWLELRSLGDMPPDRWKSLIYYQYNLEPAMREETRLFFHSLIDTNAPATELLSARYSFVNRGLAKLYNLQPDDFPTQGDTFERVAFANRNRGGLLGQASLLTLSANGIETSPVVRGVWLSEKILGIPIPPPPDDVPSLSPDLRDATSVRDLLKRHRNDDACNRCHRKIDPLGYALEHFDPIGRYRWAYATKTKPLPIDSSGTLPWGKQFTTFPEFRQHLLEQKDFFLRNLTSKLLRHALGRILEPDERADVDRILHRVAPNNYRLADLIVEIVKSDLFTK